MKCLSILFYRLNISLNWTKSDQQQKCANNLDFSLLNDQWQTFHAYLGREQVQQLSKVRWNWTHDKAFNCHWEMGGMCREEQFSLLFRH